MFVQPAPVGEPPPEVSQAVVAEVANTLDIQDSVADVGATTSETVTPIQLSEGEMKGLQFANDDGKVKLVRVVKLETVVDVIGTGDETYKKVNIQSKTCARVHSTANGKEIVFDICFVRRKRGRIKFKQKKLKRRGADSPTLKEAMSRADWLEFSAAIRKEYDQLEEEKVYNIVRRDQIPNGVRVLGTMIVLQVKRKPDGLSISTRLG